MKLDKAIQHCKERVDNTLCGYQYNQLKAWLEELRYYRSLAEQGRLVELPVQIDDTIYQLRKKRHAKGEGISPRIVGYVKILGNGKYELNHQGMTPCRESDLGKTWFLTKEEAEARLAELEKETK